jgi:hypothetical protein
VGVTAGAEVRPGQVAACSARSQYLDLELAMLMHT